MTCSPCSEGRHDVCEHDPCGNAGDCELCTLCDCDHVVSPSAKFTEAAEQLFLASLDMTEPLEAESYIVWVVGKYIGFDRIAELVAIRVGQS